MSPFALVMTLAFVLIVVAVSLWQRMELERDLLIGTVRAAAQLILVGYVLLWVFQLDSWPAMGAMLAVMLVVAARNAASRATSLPGVTWRVLGVLALTEVVTVGLMLVLRIIPATARYIIPISGIVIGNAMVNAGLLLNRLRGEMTARRAEVEVLLALGASPRQAAAGVLKTAVKAAMIPSIDALKTVGLVQLPGMMTGQILAGASPVEAVKYQLLVMYALAAASAICSMVLGHLALPLFFNRQAQLLP
jgi:putative ABC transport system permease protein